MQRKNMTQLLSEREEFLVIALTGRVGSGCSEAAALFCSDFPTLCLPEIGSGVEGLSDDEARDKRILARYAKEHWIPFDLIQVRDIIATFLLERMNSFAGELVNLLKPVSPSWLSETDSAAQEQVLDKLYEEMKAYVAKNVDRNKLTDVEKCELFQFAFKSDRLTQSAALELALKSTNDPADDPAFRGSFEFLYDTVLPAIPYENRVRFLRLTDRFLFGCADRAAQKWLEKNPDEVWDRLLAQSRSLFEQKGSFCFEHFFFVHSLMPALGFAIHKVMLEAGQSCFTETFQKYGNSLRRFGKIICVSSRDDPRFRSFPKDIFSIPRKINQFIKVLRHPFSSQYARPARIVIDSLKNPFEAMYLRDRYSAFYLFAISADDTVRNARLSRSPKRMDLRSIHFADWNESPAAGKEIYDEFKLKQTAIDPHAPDTPDEAVFVFQMTNPPQNPSADWIRIDAYENNLHPFVLQDVNACIENADVFISNPNSGEPASYNRKLSWGIVRNVCLILYPGLLLPTPVERCMQIAFTAKANSGCLSRQVGAVVTDSQYNILSLGWNDVPCGDISCARKNLLDLANGWDSPAYTEYEKQDRKFRERLFWKYNHYFAHAQTLLCGLPMRYCFKDLHLKPGEKNPMRSRAMHAEEKALALCGSTCSGGCLFTTSSPCEMCSKNAKNHHIKKIYYIEPYPGISEAQYTKSGSPDNIAEHILFDGAIGRAYTQMYTPIMPHKDILNLLGLRPSP